MSDCRSASQLAGAASAEIAQRLFSKPSESTRFGVLLDAFVEAGGVKDLEPRAELSQLIRG